MTLGSYLTSVFCTICSAEIRSEGGCKTKNQRLCITNRQLQGWRTPCDGSRSQTQEEHPEIGLLTRQVMQIRTWSFRSHKTSCLKADSFQFIVKIQKPQTTFLTTLGNQRAWSIVLGDETFSCDLQVQLQAPTSHSQVPETFREKERLGRANSGPRGSFRSRYSRVLVQKTLHHSRILLFGKRSLSNIKGQRQQRL